jgi:hypothetical protein
MKTNLKSLLLLGITLLPALCQAYPQIDQEVKTGLTSMKVYRDHDNPSLYWYIPTSIEPTTDDIYKSSLYRDDKELSFIFRGQSSINDIELQKAATAAGTSINNFSPIDFNFTKNVTCQDVSNISDVQWALPPTIGNYGEIIPISIRTTNPKLIGEIGTLITGAGMECIVGIEFKASSLSVQLGGTTVKDGQIQVRFTVK